MSCCSELPNKYEGKTVADIPELSKNLDEIKTDYKQWVTQFRCNKCNQLWCETYKEKGHGEVPEVYKCNETQQST